MENPTPSFGDPALSPKFWERAMVAPDGCWLWTGSITKSGYGMVPWKTAYPDSKRAHRAAYQALIGPVPDGLVLDHLCRVRHCVNPSHLEAVTIRENTLRGEGRAAVNAQLVECYKGHPLTGENLYVNPSGSRMCKICSRARQRKHYRSTRAIA